MNGPRAFNLFRSLGFATLLPSIVLAAQEPARAPAIVRLVAEPAKLVMQAGDSMVFKVTAYDAGGNVVQNPNVRVGGPRRSIMFSDGHVKAFEAGSFTATATASDATGGSTVTLDIPVTITWPPVARLEPTRGGDRLRVGVDDTVHVRAGQFAPGPLCSCHLTAQRSA